MNTNSGKLRQKLKFNKFPFGVYLLLVAVIVVFFAATQGTISPAHLMNIVRQSAPLGVAAMGQTIVLLVGGIDLSVGATMSMVNLVAASVMGGSDAQILPALLICMALCLLVGLLNGYIIATFKMQPFLVTMAMSMIIEGGYYIYTKGIAKGSIATGIRFISEGWIGIVPIAAIIWLVIWLVLSVVLHHTPYGHRLYITGGALLAIGGFSMLMEFFAHLTFGTPMFHWSLYVVSGCGLAGIFFVLSGFIRPLHAWMERKFFV